MSKASAFIVAGIILGIAALSAHAAGPVPATSGGGGGGTDRFDTPAANHDIAFDHVEGVVHRDDGGAANC